MDILMAMLAFLGLLQGFSLLILSWIRSDIKTLFGDVTSQGTRLTVLETEHKKNHPVNGTT